MIIPTVESWIENGRLKVHIDLKHLPGQHDQGSHGTGGGGEDKTTPEEKVAFASRASALADKMSDYSTEYKGEGKPEFAAQCDSIASKLRDGKVIEANAEFKEGDLKYDIGNTSIAVQNLKDEMTIASTVGTDWGTKPGTYTAYRSGDPKDTNRGIFLAADEAGAKSYARDGETTEKYQIKLDNPYVAPSVMEAVAEFTGKTLGKIYQERDRAANVGDWWMKMDAKAVTAAKKMGYDSLVWTKPAPPALREVVVFKSSQITKG